MRTAMANEGVTKFSDTSLMSSIKGDTTGYGDQSVFRSEFEKIFNVLESYNPGAIPDDKKIVYSPLAAGDYTVDTSNYTSFFLADGSIWYVSAFVATNWLFSEKEIKSHGGHMYLNFGQVYIDVNGAKKPNKLGRDLFEFTLGQDGNLYPYQGTNWQIWDGGSLSSNWKQYTLMLCSPNDSNSPGSSCAARIIDIDNWEMKY